MNKKPIDFLKTLREPHKYTRDFAYVLDVNCPNCESIGEYCISKNLYYKCSICNFVGKVGNDGDRIIPINNTCPNCSHIVEKFPENEMLRCPICLDRFAITD